MDRDFRRIIYEAGLQYTGIPSPDMEKELVRLNRKRKAKSRLWLTAAAAAVVAAVTLPLALDLGGHNNQASNKMSSVYIVDNRGSKVFIDDTVRCLDYSALISEIAQHEGGTQDQAPSHMCTVYSSKGKGEDFVLTLSDGTVIRVNSGSSVTFPSKFSDKGERVVALIYGEAFFEVARDTARPFIVQTPVCDTKVLGTKFNVQAYNDSACNITLAEGSVAVKHSRDTWDDGRLLEPGENASVAPNKITVTGVDLQNYLSWIEGYYYYDRKSVAEVLESICNRYDYRVEGRADTDVRVRFWFDKNDDIEDVIKRLGDVANVKIEIKGHRILLK